MQVDRLFQMLYILLDKGRVTAGELADTFEVSVRTVYRDVDRLSGAGVPIYASKGKGGGISLLDDFIMDKSILSNDEQNSLLVGLETLKATQYENVDGAIMKLKSLFNKSDDSWIEVDFSNWGSSDEDKLEFENLKYALTHSYAIEFEYCNYYGVKTKRKINPMKLTFKHKSWYLQGFCLLKNDYRTFKVRRISGVAITEDKFNRDDYKCSNVDVAYNESPNMIDLKFVLAPRVERRIYDEFDEKDYIKDKEGNYIIEVKIAEDEWLYNYIISFGEHIRIIEPEYLNDIVKRRLENTLKNYK